MEAFNLSMDNILDANELEFGSEEKEVKTEVENKEPEQKETEQETIENTAEVIDAEHLELESVGGGNNKPEEIGSTGKPVEDSSPAYSSIASAFKVDGVPLFSEADDDELSKIESAEDFEELVGRKLEEAVESRLGDVQKRINDALTYGMQPSDIQLFENSLKNLNSISEDDIAAESEEGENLRRQLIYTDLINRGLSEDRAREKTQRFFDAGTDVDEAKDALESNKSFYQEKYDEVFNSQKQQYEKVVEQRKKDAKKLKESIFDDDKAFGDVSVSKAIRQKVYDAINKPIGKDSEGNPVYALQKYADENPVEFRKNIAYYFVITDGFKNLDKVKEIVGSEVRKKEISALERTLNSTARNSDGSLKLVGGNKESYGSGEPQWQIEL